VKATVIALAFALAIAIASRARAQSGPSAHVRSRGEDDAAAKATPTALSGPNGLLGHFGVNVAVRLMRSDDADDRLRGLERAAAMHTAEGLALLERAARVGGPGGLDPRLPDEGIARKDPRALLATVHGLAAWMENEGARSVLAEIVRAPNDSLWTRPGAATSRDPGSAWTRALAGGDADGRRVALARQEAAIALASSGNPIALEALVAASRSGGEEQEAALVALSVHPPTDPSVLGGVALTTPGTIAMAVQAGDLRALDAILGILRASDPVLRAAALEALAAAGDTRAAEVARGSLHDDDARVRVAAAGALSRLSLPDAAPAVEALIGDDATALDGLRMAQIVQGEGITKAAAARAAASADPALRGAAIAALGRQNAPSAVRALVAFVMAPADQADAIAALARSPSPVALEALQEMADTRREGLARSTAGAPDGLEPAAVSRRLAARAYFVRRFVRGDRSRPLDALLESLAVSRDPRDRAVGMQALVALDERRVDAALSDPDPRVRRAGAMGALGHRDAHTAEALAARGATEPDEATRRVLALGWEQPSGSDEVPTSVLSERAIAGGPDAPVAAFALARRSDETLAPQVDALMGSRDPLLRAEAARGLGLSRADDAAGRLTRAYPWEADPRVRRAIVGALALRAARGAAGTQAAREGVLDLAARLDPDPVARWTAQTAIARSPASPHAANADVREIAWIRLIAAEGAAPALDRTALVADAAGRAVPIVFDDEGFALVPGISPGEARLRLAPDSPSYSALAP
jgi:HEAT repeat protein